MKVSVIRLAWALIFTMLVVTTLVVPARGGVINFPPPVGANTQTVAANDPAHGNVWTGIAQSFTAQDPHILFGFYVASFSGAPGSDTVLFSLYSGDGQSSNLLGQASAPVTLATNFVTQFVQVDFSSISLTPGNQYTVVASRPSQQLPPLGTYSNLSLLYNSLNNSYPGGRFYFVGASYDESLPAFALRDLAFNVTPVFAVFSLSGDWSNTTNPNGPWSYNQGSAPLPLVPDFTAGNPASACNQPAWAPSNSAGNFLPVFMKPNACTATALGTDPVNGLPNVMPGDIVTHTVDPFNGNPANGVANFLFTLPVGDDGRYEIRGSVWDAGLLFGTTRPQDWKLLVNGAQMASGHLSGTVSRSQAEPFDVFANLAGGNTVQLQLFEDPNAAAGFFVRTNMRITEVTQTTCTLIGVTFAGAEPPP